MVQNGDERGALAEAALHHLPPNTLLNNGQYRIVRSIGEGGFGITYEAVDNLDRRVAIKECFPSHSAHRSRGSAVLPTSAKKEGDFNIARRNFLREAQVLAMVDHPSVVRVQTFFEENETAYMAMDFIQGQNLDDLMANDPGKLTPPYVYRICHDLLSAMDYLHENRILHRDIKPSNIRIDRWGTPILIDFGTAKQITSNETARKTTREIVSDGYSPLEFYERGEKQAEASDLYSLAATLHHVITGTVPPPAQQRAKRIWEGKPDAYVPLAGRFLMHERTMLTLIDRAMSMDLADRPVDAKAWLRTMPDMETASYHPEQPQAQRLPRTRRAVFLGVVGGMAAAAAFSLLLLQTGLIGAGAAGSATAAEQSQTASALAELESENRSLEAMLSDRDTELSRLQLDIEEAQRRRDETVGTLDARAAQIVELQTLLTEARGEAGGLEHRLRTANTRVQSTEERLDTIEALLREAFGEVPSIPDLRVAIARIQEAPDVDEEPEIEGSRAVQGGPDEAPDLLQVAAEQRDFLAAFQAAVEEQDISSLTTLLDNGTAPAFVNATLALLGPSVENDAYTSRATELQRLLQQERCGIETVDGIFGVSSEAAFSALLDGVGDTCGPLPRLPRIRSLDPVYSEWIVAASGALEQLRDCPALRNNNACLIPGPGDGCARHGGCLRGGVYSMSVETLCGLYDDIDADDWEDLFHGPDAPGSIYVSVETYLPDVSDVIVRARFAAMQARLPRLPLRLAEAVNEDGSRSEVVQMASGILDVNVAHELVLYANYCSRPGSVGSIAPRADAFAARRGDGIMHLPGRVFLALDIALPTPPSTDP